MFFERKEDGRVPPFPQHSTSPREVERHRDENRPGYLNQLHGNLSLISVRLF